MEKEKVLESKMGTMPVRPLLLNVSLPIVLSMFVQAFYNVADSFFVARLSEEAFTAVSLVFPVQNLIIAVAVGTGVGINSLLSRRLGEKDFEAANKTAENGVFITIITWLVFVVLGLLFTNAYFAGYAQNPEIGPVVAKMGKEYMYIVTIASFGVFVSITMERLLQATGRSVYSMVSQMVGAVVNIILDPIMIFGLLGFPKMGVVGAAIATVIGQVVSMCLGLYFNAAHNKEIKIRLAGFRPHGSTIKNIYVVGVPSIIMQSLGSVMVFGLNQILAAFSSAAVSVLGVYFRLQSFVFMPLFGFNNGMIPIVAYSYGAGKPKRIEEAIWFTLKIYFGLMLTGLALFWIFPAAFIGIFTPTPDMLEIGISALRIISISYVFAPVSLLAIGVFQALGEGIYSMVMAIIRQLLLILPLAWVLSKFFQENGVWMAFPIAEIITFFVGIVFLRKVWREKIRVLESKMEK